MTRSYKILYAEDDVSLNEITMELLIGEGFECVSVANGLEAKAKLETEDFDLLLTDFLMPFMNGAELLLWCRKTGKHLPVIFISGNLERLPLENLALEDCCTSMVTKPIAFDDLIMTIMKSLSRSHELDCIKVASYEDTLVAQVFLGQHFKPVLPR